MHSLTILAIAYAMTRARSYSSLLKTVVPLRSVLPINRYDLAGARRTGSCSDITIHFVTKTYHRTKPLTLSLFFAHFQFSDVHSTWRSKLLPSWSSVSTPTPNLVADSRTSRCPRRIAPFASWVSDGLQYRLCSWAVRRCPQDVDVQHLGQPRQPTMAAAILARRPRMDPFANLDLQLRREDLGPGRTSLPSQNP